jgi:hypothetical protein
MVAASTSLTPAGGGGEALRRRDGILGEGAARRGAEDALANGIGHVAAAHRDHLAGHLLPEDRTAGPAQSEGEAGHVGQTGE